MSERSDICCLPRFLAPLVVLILAAVIDRDHLIEAATTEASKTVDVLHEHTLKVMETQELALNQIDDGTRESSQKPVAAVGADRRDKLTQGDSPSPRIVS